MASAEFSTPNPSPTPRRKNRLSSFHRLSIPRTPLNSITNPLSTGNASIQPSPRVSPNSTPNTPKTPAYRISSPLATPATNASRRRSLKHRPQQMSKAEIEQMYADTLKLSQDNKINVRNTWKLSLIDYMGMLFRTDGTNQRRSLASLGAQEEMNFHRAGVTLDAGVKIYCSRVDSVHTNAFKMLGGLSRTGGEGREGEREEMGDEEEGGEDPNGKRRKRGRRTGRITLESNLASITSQKVETDLAVDPLFQKMSAAFDDGGAKGMLLNNLPVGPRGQVVFDSGEPADCLLGGYEEDIGVDEYDVSSVLPTKVPTENDVICSAFLAFFKAKERAYNDAGNDEKAHDDLNDGRNIDDHGSLDLDVDFEYGNEDLQNAEALASFAGADIGGETSHEHELVEDDDDVNIFGEDSNISGRQSLESSMSLAIAARRGSLDLVEAGVALVEDSEYSFFDTASIAGWAGPLHWRFRAVTASSDALGENYTKKKPKRPRGKNAMLLDFSEAAPKIDFAKEFARGKTDTSYHLSVAVLDSFSEKKVTLPEDLHFSVRSLRSLFLKPEVYIKPGNRTASARIETAEDNAVEGWYDFENDCDRDNFCPANMEQDDFGNNEHNENDPSLETEVDLIPEPTRVERIDINYAKVAKKVDVRLLKSGMWSKLCNEVSPSTPTLTGEEQLGSNKDALDEDIRQGKSQTLRNVVKDLPSFMPEPSLSDVSLPYVFICLLHLANEKTLKISQVGEGTSQDLVITIAESESMGQEKQVLPEVHNKAVV